MDSGIVKIAEELGLHRWQVENTLRLFDDGATIPFISRYRKEVTGSLDEQVLQEIKSRYEKLRELNKRRESVIASVSQQGKLTPELRARIESASTMSELEDIYLPFRPRRRTRATVAREKGLEPLAALLFRQQERDPVAVAGKYVTGEVKSIDEALAGASDIIAEWISESEKSRMLLRKIMERESVITSRVVKGKEEDGAKFRDYFEWSGPLPRIPSHRLHAMLRGESEGYLRIKISPPDQEGAIEKVKSLFVKGANASSHLVALAVEDGCRRLILPSLESEIRSRSKERADEDAIAVFASNLRQLLLAPPLGRKRVMAIDPGFRTGCKVVCLDSLGSLLHNETIYPHPPRNQTALAVKKIVSLAEAYKIEAIAIGNGTAGRETEEMIRMIRFDSEISIFMVNEAGASIYSASEVAREEFPDYDVTVRGAVSIGRRLTDPLAELVKIDPRSIGVGQYQHDVNQGRLREALDTVVESCVNAVGVEINTASRHLLSYVSGLGPQLAANIVEYRSQNGPFRSRTEIRSVKRMGEKAFEQSAGFLRIRDAENPLDGSAVHPESYYVVEKMASDAGCSVAELMSNRDIRAKISLDNYFTESCGLPTLKDILRELDKPGRDPRKMLEEFRFADVRSIDDLKEGETVPGIVRNITRFGAFVDIGVKQDGLVHISNLASGYIDDPAKVVSVNQQVRVLILSVDKERSRIQLSMKGIEQ